MLENLNRNKYLGNYELGEAINLELKEDFAIFKTKLDNDMLPNVSINWVLRYKNLEFSERVKLLNEEYKELQSFIKEID